MFNTVVIFFSSTPISEKSRLLIFPQLRQKRATFHNIFTVKFRKELQRKLEVKLTSQQNKSVVLFF